MLDLSDETKTAEEMAAYIQIATSSADVTLRKFARDHMLSEDWHVIASVRMTRENDLFHIQRTNCQLAQIYVSVQGYMSLLEPSLTYTERKKKAARFKAAALKAIKLATILSKQGSALMTGDLAYSITEERKQFRRQIILSQRNALNDRYFKVSGTLTVTEQLTDTSVTADVIEGISLDTQIESLKHILSRRMLMHAENEELIDILELARNRKPIPQPVEFQISLEGNSINTHVVYNTPQTEEA